ncbi:MAG: type IV secretory system conjugative DNA transfer family protein [Actinobacteria bacterium]|nr:type IV secretory system conjugative DNA transfer family protein [Actinomycetota bacterium]
MSWLWSAFRHSAAASFKAQRAVNRGVGDAVAHHRLSNVPRQVRRRGFLAPGDGPAPLGADLLDYRGVLEYRRAQAASARQGAGVALGALVDVPNSASGTPFRLPLDEFYEHLAIVGPPGSGKTVGVIIPLVVRLLRAGASVVVIDGKGDLHDQISRFAQEVPGTGLQVRKARWSLIPGAGGSSWNPLQGVSVNDFQAIEGIKTAICGKEAPDPRHQDFHNRDMSVLGDALRATIHTHSGPTLADVSRVFSDPAMLAAVANDSRVPLPIRQTLGREVADNEQLWSLRTKLQPFAQEPMRSATSTGNLDLSSVLRQQTLLTIGAEFTLKSLGEQGSALMINRLLALLEGRFGTDSGVPVVFVIDEAPALRRNIDLPHALATIRAARAGLVIAAQQATQFGAEEREQANILDSCKTVMLLEGASELSARYLQGRIGKRTVGTYSVGRDARGMNRRTRTEARSEQVEMLGVREIVDPPFPGRTAFVHSRGIGASPLVLNLQRGILGE